MSWDDFLYDMYYGEGTLKDDIEAYLTENGITPANVDIDADDDDENPFARGKAILIIRWDENGDRFRTDIPHYHRYDKDTLFDMWLDDREKQLPEIYAEPD